jgi:hypothetical protein
MTVRTLIVICLSGLLAFSCKKTDRPTAATEEPADALQVQADNLRDSVEVHWVRLIESDNRKLDNVERVLREMSSYPYYDRGRIADLRDLQSRMRQIRYDRESLASDERIDRYDIASDSLMYGLMQLFRSVDQADKYSSIDALIDEIKSADDSTIIYRVYYDKYAKELNEFTSTHTNTLKKLGGTYAEIPHQHTFEFNE